MQPITDTKESKKDKQAPQREELKYTVKELAATSNLTPGAIHMAITKKRLRYRLETKNGRPKRYILWKDWISYLGKKYSRSLTTVDGQRVFDNWKGAYSVPQAARLMGVTTQHLYYSIRAGNLPYTRIRCAYVLDIEDIKSFAQKNKTKLDWTNYSP